MPTSLCKAQCSTPVEGAVQVWNEKGAPSCDLPCKHKARGCRRMQAGGKLNYAMHIKLVL